MTATNRRNLILSTSGARKAPANIDTIIPKIIHNTYIYIMNASCLILPHQLQRLQFRTEVFEPLCVVLGLEAWQRLKLNTCFLHALFRLCCLRSGLTVLGFFGGCEACVRVSDCAKDRADLVEVPCYSLFSFLFMPSF